MTDFLLELRSEEIPARMQVKAKDDLARLFAEEIAKAGLTATAIETFATPRRLALIARGLPDQTAAVSEERKGPRSNAPEQALAGFLRSTGLTREQLVERDGVFFAVIDKPGRATAEVLAEAIPAVVRAFPWPKSMRWGDASFSTESLRWVRPLQGIVALFGDAVVSCEVDGITSSAATMGHRFHHSGPLIIRNADSYVEQLRDAHVIVHLSERTTLIRDGARTAAAAEGLVLVEDEGLVLENAGLTEWPVPLLGRFDAAFLDVPREVIQLTMRTNQKYFACTDADGALANAFVCTANIDASDGGAAIVAGNRKVLAARLSDAKFFWENDLKVPLAMQAEKLSQIVFHEKLGTVADKVERVAKLARWLCEEGIVKPSSLRGEGDAKHRERPELHVTSSPGSAGAAPPSPQSGEGLASLAETAARLCKADLVTGMVGEFPELQGIIGGHLARAQGLPDVIADAIRDHYKPVGQGDDVPTAPVAVAVSLADKLDTLVGFFLAEEKPTGSKDPFALRRAALAINAISISLNLRVGLRDACAVSEIELLSQVSDDADDVIEQSEAHMDFLKQWEATLDFVRASDFDLVEKKVMGLFVRRNQVDRFAGLRALISERSDDVNAFDPVMEFLTDRLKVQQREAGVRHDLIDAVFALGGEDDLVRLLARVKALQAFVGTPEGADLLAGYKRAANILKKDQPSSLRGEGDAKHRERNEPPVQASPGSAGAAPPSPRSEEGEETALTTALDTAEPLAAAAIDAENFEAAMSALATLRTPIDAFFENVTVNDPDPAKRAARLALLARFRDAVHRVADFSKIEG
ncbi:glycine--tRNA ligase subunit beta [Sphingomonas sp. SUN039]|uniref:glycine--tRNA ligase subunit beta n=1 Tax=Sphingomonas sp. SUN039 TaxID=2937787 RepID=UPI00216478A3|nr:glycine--tRNA ligase subunit beta [Sphingomonas sp. SUN039]UVO53963.1 glycine--tRNA ligase subunit beta [Sphingomonas sp. SUN039]